MNFPHLSRAVEEDRLRAPAGAELGGAGAGDPAVPDPNSQKSPEIPMCNGERCRTALNRRELEGWGGSLREGGRVAQRNGFSSLPLRIANANVLGL